VLKYLPHLDRWQDLRTGLASAGMHGYVLDEIEVGARAASALDCERVEGSWLTIMMAFPRVLDGSTPRSGPPRTC
jgi:hypothetical protein